MHVVVLVVPGIVLPITVWVLFMQYAEIVMKMTAKHVQYVAGDNLE
jgi:hypothetical protein